LKTIAFFDFDGTVIKGDSMLLFTKKCCGKLAITLGLIAIIPKLISLKLGSTKYFGLKEKFFKYTIKGMHRSALENCAGSLTPMLEERVWPSISERLKWHEQNGHEIVIVSASAEIWLKPWVEQKGYKLVASRLAFSDEIFTGKLSTPNCKGSEKVKRIQESYDLNQYDEVYAYGDTKSDIPMLDLADHPFWVSMGELSTFAKKGVLYN
jgi:HAD superfamily hydrolase (TIGR01490 family)